MKCEVEETTDWNRHVVSISVILYHEVLRPQEGLIFAYRGALFQGK